MSICKAYDVTYVRFRIPALEPMQTFLTDFGMTVAERDAETLYMRGHGESPFFHVSVKGEDAAFLGFGMWLSSLDDLERVAAHDGVTIEDLKGPGGGKVARLTDPDGFTVEAVADRKMAEPLPSPAHQGWNHGGTYPRQSEFRRVPKGPSHVQRLGHVVLTVGNFRRSEAWYKERFGLVTSDEIRPEPDVGIGAFLRCDRGDQPCDHHTLALLESPRPPAFVHSAYEVADLDDLMAGHEHLKAGGYSAFWGVGRHLLGSQVFDYWRDPFGNEIEHWTDGDQLTAADGGKIASMEQLMAVQWGMETPPLPSIAVEDGR